MFENFPKKTKVTCSIMAISAGIVLIDGLIGSIFRPDVAEYHLFLVVGLAIYFSIGLLVLLPVFLLSTRKNWALWAACTSIAGGAFLSIFFFVIIFRSFANNFYKSDPFEVLSSFADLFAFVLYLFASILLIWDKKNFERTAINDKKTK